MTANERGDHHINCITQLPNATTDDIICDLDRKERTNDCLHIAELYLSSDQKEIGTDCFHVAE